ncbi:MAG: SDR family NAD(P)-dependent oxidoreductase [Nannocystis sp.]|nr:SDR family NAD(P)-dependent oxidoreductase [Nannocystis sp.]
MPDLADSIDAALEWSIFGSFTRIGSCVRRRLDHWTPLDADLRGRVIVLTGATSGLGLAAARAFVRMGATLEIIARDPAKAARTCTDLRQIPGASAVTALTADMGDLAAIRRVAAELLARHSKIHALIHNAGALDDVRHESPQGVEQTVASQLVGPALLTDLLLPALRAAAPSRVLWVTSGGMYSEPLAVAQLDPAGAEYNGVTAYARAKRAQIALVQLDAERLRADRIVVHAMHPGWADTPGVARSLPRFRRLLSPLLRTPEDAADTLIWLTVDDDRVMGTSGRLWLDRRPRPLHRLARTRRADTPEERAHLRQWLDEKHRLAADTIS